MTQAPPRTADRTSLASTGQLLAWAAKEVKQRTGPARAYTGRYPDRSGPTMAHAPRVADLADILQAGAIG